MATYKKKKDKQEEQYKVSFKKDYMSDWDIHSNYIQTFDPYEAMLLGQVYDSVSQSIDSSKITDSYAATLAIERAARVMGKLPEGETEATGKSDAGKAAFMDILRQKWIYPNANAQQPFETKLRLWQLYSSVYGYMPMFYDWNISLKGDYIGPDCWLWNPRNLVPQQGRTSIEDMDYITALTWVGRKKLEAIKDDKSKKTKKKEGESAELDEDDGWNVDALQLLCEKAENESTDADTEHDTLTERDRISQSTKKGICLATRYEAGEDGEWITFAPDHGYIEVRRLKNPHKNGRIPFVIKYSQPLFDSFYGLGEFQRKMPLQFARDGLTNFYFKGIKMSLIRPIVANANGVLKHTLDYREGAVMMETIPNSIRTLDVGNGGLSTYQGAMSSLTGSMLAQDGSQNASLPGAETLNPSQGKTPAAINLYEDKEATRDGQERQLLELAIEQLTDGFNSLIVNIGTEEIPVNLFSDDIEDIRKAGLTDVLELFKNLETNEQQSAGVLKIDPTKLKGVEYRFNIARGTTAKLSKEKQRQAILEEMTMLGKYQNIFKEDPRIQIHWDKITEVYNTLSDVPGSDEFITIQEGPSPKEVELMQKEQELAQKEQEMQQQILQMQQKDQEMQAQALQAPTVSVGGNQFNDPDIARAAQEIL